MSAKSKAKFEAPVGIEQIMRFLPHRYPMLLVDRVETFDPQSSRIVTIKNVTINEPYFGGHFPGHPVMPGIMMIEAMAQSAIIAWRMEHGDEVAKGKAAYFSTIDRARFRHPVFPGDTVKLDVSLTRNFKGRLYYYQGRATVGDVLVAEADFSAAVVDLPPPAPDA